MIQVTAESPPHPVLQLARRASIARGTGAGIAARVRDAVPIAPRPIAAVAFADIQERNETEGVRNTMQLGKLAAAQ